MVFWYSEYFLFHKFTPKLENMQNLKKKTHYGTISLHMRAGTESITCHSKRTLSIWKILPETRTHANFSNCPHRRGKVEPTASFPIIGCSFEFCEYFSSEDSLPNLKNSRRTSETIRRLIHHTRGTGMGRSNSPISNCSMDFQEKVY